MSQVRPWDLFNQHVSRETAESRLEICRACPSYKPLTHRCDECGCVMNLKVKIPDAECPLGHWGKAEKAVS